MNREKIYSTYESMWQKLNVEYKFIKYRKIFGKQKTSRTNQIYQIEN